MTNLNTPAIKPGKLTEADCCTGDCAQGRRCKAEPAGGLMLGVALGLLAWVVAAVLLILWARYA